MRLCDWSAQATVEDCHGCTLLLGPIDGALYVRECTDLRVAAVCRQFRARNCAAVSARLHTNGPVIEGSHGMAFGAWGATEGYDGLGAHRPRRRARM